MTPVPFIVGAPRSGTTLLRLMLDAHPDLCIPPETHFLPSVLGLTGSDAELRDAFYHAVTSASRWTDFGIPAEVFSASLACPSEFSIASGVRAFYVTYAMGCRKRRWGDKTPGYAIHIAQIQEALPEAHFIHLIRDGRDVSISNREAWWKFSPHACEAARLWVGLIEETRRQARCCPNYLEVRYEDLIGNPAGILRRICEFIQLPYSPLMETYYLEANSRMSELGDWVGDNGEVVATRSQRLEIHQMVERPPDTSRAGRWRHIMTPQEIWEFQKVAGETLRDLGYDLLPNQL
jgi:hypothetical protein